ncbi:hypothetical protein ACS0TY_002216 [Phlomoides rotata]
MAFFVTGIMSTLLIYGVLQELVETTSSAPPFVQTGYIYGVYGLQGEVWVKPSTDFPEMRFSKPGIRWLKQQVSGTDTIHEIELVEGQGNPRQSWIARKLVGSAILVRDEDRPVLEDGEFYTHDLIGMTVILKESGEPVGTVVNIFNSGVSDLLQVKLNSLRKIPDQIELNVRSDERSKKERREIKAADDSIERWQSHSAS